MRRAQHPIGVKVRRDAIGGQDSDLVATAVACVRLMLVLMNLYESAVKQRDGVQRLKDVADQVEKPYEIIRPNVVRLPSGFQTARSR